MSCGSDETYEGDAMTGQVRSGQVNLLEDELAGVGDVKEDYLILELRRGGLLPLRLRLLPGMPLRDACHATALSHTNSTYIHPDSQDGT